MTNKKVKREHASRLDAIRRLHVTWLVIVKILLYSLGEPYAQRLGFKLMCEPLLLADQRMFCHVPTLAVKRCLRRNKELLAALDKLNFGQQANTLKFILIHNTP